MHMTKIALVAALMACSTSPVAPVNSTFALKVGDRVSISGADLSIRFVRVAEDSRCPSGVQCIWAGNGRIELDVRAAGQNSLVFLNTFDGAKEVVVGAYRISLIALEPAPVATQQIPAESYRASLRVIESGTVCTEEARPGLMVALADSLTGVTTGFTNVAIIAREGAYADSAVMATYPQPPSTGGVALAYERRGTYDVSVRADGYATWTRTGVIVTGDVCHVATVALTARLAR
jgi:hypothetical protein